MKVDLNKACSLIKEGRLVAIPTDTVYGLAASISRDSALKKLYKLKKRNPSKPVLILSDNVSSIEPFLTKDAHVFLKQAKEFWPGALSIICDTSSESPIKGFDTLGFRIPNHASTLQLLKETGPLFVSSANTSDFEPAKNSSAVEDYFGSEFPVFDGGEVEGYVSSIIKVSKGEVRLIRQGALSKEALTKVFKNLKSTR
jgi:L-threonylcarbamoyladenylate synthase